MPSKEGESSSAGGMPISGCWVARTVYGEDNPRWLLFREWLMADAPRWFRTLYLRRGESFARWIAPHATVKSIIRIWMDSVIERKHTGALLICSHARVAAGG